MMVKLTNNGWISENDNWFDNLIYSDDEPESYRLPEESIDAFIRGSIKHFRSQNRTISSFITNQAIESAKQVANNSGKKELWHNGRMTEPLTRPELDAKLETIEARMDGRLARIEDRFASMEKTMEQINQSLKEQRNTPWKAASATIAVMIATIIAVGALAFTAFDSGRETAQVAAGAKADISTSVAEVKEMIKGLQQPQQAAAQVAPQPAAKDKN